MNQIEKNFKRIEEISDRDLNLEFESDKGKWVELSIEIFDGALETDKGHSNLIVSVLKEVKQKEDKEGKVFTITSIKLEPYTEESKVVFVKGYFT